MLKQRREVKKARPAGFEPTTTRLEGACSNPLSYGRSLIWEDEISPKCR
jgi:hypothetical protein